jgi:hypothetical protein
MNEEDYKPVLAAYLGRRLTVDEYITAFLKQWKCDRDEAWGKPLPEESPKPARFHELMNRLFTSCDCYDEHPEATHEISEDELRQEVQLFYQRMWEE